MSKVILEYKDLVGGAVKDVDTKNRIITGYLSDFDTKDSYGDVVEKGAFKKTLSERKEVWFLNQHKWDQPHTTFSTLVEDSKGLYFESNPMPDTSYSNDALKLYEMGIMKEHSFGYQTIKSDYDKKSGIRYLKELKLFEGSNVTRGANSNTPFTGFKSDMTIKDINEQQANIIKAVRNGTFTDETFVLLELALKQLQKDAYELGKKSLDNKEPLIDTPKLIVEPKQESIKTINEFIKTI